MKIEKKAINTSMKQMRKNRKNTTELTKQINNNITETRHLISNFLKINLRR